MPTWQTFHSRKKTFKRTTTRKVQNSTTETFEEKTTEIDRTIEAKEVNIKPKCGVFDPHFNLDVLPRFGREAEMRARTVRRIAKECKAILLLVFTRLLTGLATELGRELCNFLSICTNP